MKFVVECINFDYMSCIFELTANRMFMHGINYNTCFKHSQSNAIVQSIPQYTSTFAGAFVQQAMMFDGFMRKTLPIPTD